MTEFLTSYAGVIALIAIVAAATSALLLVESTSNLRRWEAWAEELEDENDRLRNRLRGAGAS